LNEQRNTVYSLRDKILRKEGLLDVVKKMIADYIIDQEERITIGSSFNWKELSSLLQEAFLIEISTDSLREELGKYGDIEELADNLAETVFLTLKKRISYNIPEEVFYEAIKVTLLNIIDMKWIDHLYKIDELREGISLRSYGERNPLVEFKLDAAEAFHEMMRNVRRELVFVLGRMRITESVVPTETLVSLDKVSVKHEEMGQFGAARMNPFEGATTGNEKVQPIRAVKRPGPNEPCWCGSGKKYKKCHMQSDLAKELESSTHIR